MVCFDDLEPLKLRCDTVFGEPVVEEDFDGGFFAVVVVVGDETDKSTFGAELEMF